MATPANGDILFSDVRNVLSQSNPAEISNFYDTANRAGPTGLMYHNLNMASGNATTAKVAIFDKYNATQNYALTNWYNYEGDPSMVMSFDIVNNSVHGIDIDIQIVDSSNLPQGTIYATPTISGNGGTAVGTVSTGCITSNVTAGYRIFIQSVTFNPPPIATPPGPSLVTFSAVVNIDSASDTDGVGAGTTRTIYSPFLREESDEIPGPPPIPINPFPVKIVDNAGGLIANNKRTSIQISIS